MGNKQQGRHKKVKDYQQSEQEIAPDYSPPSSKMRPVGALNEAQGQYMALINANIITFGIGPAGTGKTYLAAAMACEALQARKIHQIIITRPAVPSDEDLGALPGEIGDKFAPYFAPVADVLYERLGKSHVEGMMKTGRIIIQPLAYMRGKSYKDAWIILDEAQNTSPKQMKMFLTRIGEGCKAIVNGDLKQQDRPGESGLRDATSRLKGVVGISTVEFTKEDIVRSGIVRAIIDRYET